MAGTGNPYLEEYAQQQHLYGSPVGVQPRKARRMARLARLKKMQEEQEQAAASQAEFAGGFPEPAKEPSPIEKRLAQYQEAWQGYLKDAATLNRAPTEEEALAYQKMANPLLVQAELADEYARKKAWEEYWNAVDAGNGEAIDALLPANGEMWDAHRKEREQLEQAREYISTLDPVTQKPLIEQYNKALKSSWEAHKENEKRLEEYSKRLDAGIARRAAAEREIGAGEAPTGYFATIGDKLKEFGPPTLGWMGKQLERPVNVVAAALTGDVGLPFVSLFDKDIQAKGAQNRAIATEAVRQASEDVGNMSSASGVAATLNPVLPTLKYGRKLGTWLSELSDQTEGLGYLVPGAAGNVALTKAKDFFSGVTKPEERNEKYGTTTSAFAVDLALDPTAWLPSGMASKAFSRIIKPIEPMLDAMSKRIGVKATAKAVRRITIGGYPLEDPLMAKAAVTAKAAEIDASKEFFIEAYRARNELESAWKALPPEVQGPAKEGAVVKRLIEEVPKRPLKGASVDDLMEYKQLAGEKRLEILGEIPPQHRNQVTRYAELVEDKNALLKALSDKRNLGVYDLSEGILEGYYARRWSPLFKQYLAEHPELTRELVDTRAMQFGERKTRELLYGEAEDIIRKKYKWTGDVWDPDESSVAFGDFLFAGKRAARNAETRNFLEVFGVRPSTEDSTKAVRVIDDAIRGFREGAEVAGERAAAAGEDVSKFVKGRKAAGQVATQERRTYRKLETLADRMDTAGREGAAVRAVAGEAKDLAPISSPRLREVEEAFDGFRADLKERMVGGLYTGGEIPGDIQKAMAQLDSRIKAIRDEFFSVPRDLDDFAHLSNYQKAVLPKYRKAMREFAADVKASAPSVNRSAAKALAADVDAAIAQLDRLAVVEEGLGRGVSAGVRERARRLAREAKEAASRADFHTKTPQEQIDIIKAELRKAGIRAPEGHMTALEFLDEFKVRPPEARFYDELVELATTYIPKSRVEEFRQIRHIADPGKLRQILNRLTGWVSRSVLATPGSVSKDIKGQIINAAITDPNILRHTDDAGRLILSGKVDDDLAELMAAGLERPSFDQIISPSVIKATEEFGGGALGKAAGVVEESGFTGGAIRGLGKAAQKVPGLKTIGKSVEAVGKGVGYVGRKSLNARQTSESIFRLATYKAAKARGLSRDEALREVAKWWGDFSQLSKLEANVLKGFVMFFSWQLRALKIGAAHFVDHPFRTRLFLALAAGNVSGDPSFPEWAQRQGGTVIGRDEFGNPKFISMGAGSYFEPLGDIFQGEAMQRLRTDGLRGVPRGLAQTALRRLAPLAQAPIEYMTNYDSFSGGQIYLEKGQDTARTRVSDHGPASLLWLPKALKDMLGVREVVRKDDGEFSYVHVDPEWNWLFNKVAPGVGAELATVNPAADPRKDAWEAAARALGFPTYSVREQDVQKQVSNKVRILTDAMRKEIGGTGLAINDAGSVYFDQTSTIGREMAADNERWKREAAEGKYNVDAYLRWKMGAKYPEALRFIDLGAYLNGWRKGIESEREALRAPKADNLKALRGLAGREAEKEQRRRLRGAPR